MPTVSVCIPTYEPRPEHLRAAIESVRGQLFADWELLIHDDASQSDVHSIVEPFLSDPRVVFHKSPVRLGIGRNWNMCMEMGGAPLVAYLFQDDRWHSDYLDRSAEILNGQPQIGFTAANHEYAIEGQTSAAETGIYDEVRLLRRMEMHEGRLHGEEFLEEWIKRGLRPNMIGEPSFVMLRRELMRIVGPFREDMHQGLDVEYWIRCLLVTDGYWLADSLGEFRVHAAAATAKNEETGEGSTDRLRIFRSLIKALPAGPMKSLARRVLAREMLGMGVKYVKRRVFRIQ